MDNIDTLQISDDDVLALFNNIEEITEISVGKYMLIYSVCTYSTVCVHVYTVCVHTVQCVCTYSIVCVHVYTVCVHTVQCVCIQYSVCAYNTVCVHTVQCMCLQYSVCVCVYSVCTYSTVCVHVYTICSLDHSSPCSSIFMECNYVLYFLYAVCAKFWQCQT